jgi:hypothetical protein
MMTKPSYGHEASRARLQAATPRDSLRLLYSNVSGGASLRHGRNSGVPHSLGECSEGMQETTVASQKQRTAARRNVKKAAASARRKRTISKLPKKTRTALGKQGAKVAGRKRK